MLFTLSLSCFRALWWQSPQFPPSVVPPEDFAVVSSAVEEPHSKMSMRHEQLTVEQKHDSSLIPCCDAFVPGDEVEKMSLCYFLKDGV